LTNQQIINQLSVKSKEDFMKSIQVHLTALFVALVMSLALAQGTDVFSGQVFTEDSLTDEEKANLANFDDLDYRVFSDEEWEDLHLSHADDVVVHWPDGRITQGIDVHIEDLKGLFVFAPDTRILQHPVRIAIDNWTAVVGVFEGAFTEPMPLPDGGVIEPTGKAFRILMSTVGRWENGEMVEEFLFWDNQAFNQQLGLGQ
jgi:hypothetical protein